jgi:hypothetical protein
MSEHILIPLSGKRGAGKFVKISLCDYELASQYKWHYNGKYAIQKIEGKTTYLHRLILNAPKGKEVDHINGDGLDNTRLNLRLCTRQENCHNIGPAKNNTSGAWGVYWDKARQKWAVEIRVNNKKRYLGRFASKEEAAKVYAEAALELRGEFSRFNVIQVP